MVPTLESQQIGLTNAHNARQLGGYQIGDKKVKADLLLRTARLSELTAEDSTLLADKYKVQRIYDFRGEKEILAAPDIIPHGASHLALSLPFAKEEGGNKFDVKAGEERDIVKMLLTYAEHPAVQAMCTSMYDMIFFEESSQEVYRQFFADLVTLDPADGAVLWHCTQGKDRAGCASAMLLAALGAERDLIMVDFTLSKHYYDPHIAQIVTTNEAQETALTTLISANPAIFEATLDKVDARYGSLRDYLTECIGVTSEMMETLREKYLEN
ncbi:MAG: tyrosine-protein phosphatase [Bacteroidaceae bacterium]|nr:tyrosine-protein phosphatase [Bacteroidaceae bacterium]